MIVTNLVKTPLKALIVNYSRRLYCSSEVDLNTYLRLSSETLESLNDRFSEMIEDHEDRLAGADTTLADGVLTVKLSEHGTYVINKQTPNQQIWLSSPVSGPYRFDIIRVRFLNIAKKKHKLLFVLQKNWVYKHTEETLHALLDREVQKFIQTDPKFRECFMGEESEHS